MPVHIGEHAPQASVVPLSVPDALAAHVRFSVGVWLVHAALPPPQFDSEPGLASRPTLWSLLAYSVAPRVCVNSIGTYHSTRRTVPAIGWPLPLLVKRSRAKPRAKVPPPVNGVVLVFDTNGGVVLLLVSPVNV